MLSTTNTGCRCQGIAIELQALKEQGLVRTKILLVTLEKSEPLAQLHPKGVAPHLDSTILHRVRSWLWTAISEVEWLPVVPLSMVGTANL